MSSLLKTLRYKSSEGLSKRDDDWADRLSRRYTVVILVSFAIVTTMIQISKEPPIVCWCENHFQKSWIKYVNSYCFVTNTYYLPYSEEIPAEPAPESYLRHYQWISFILLGQAVFFYVPNIVWHGLNQKSGIDSDDILEAAITLNNLKDTIHRAKILRVLKQQLKFFAKTYKDKKKISLEDDIILCRVLDRLTCEFGGYLCVLFLFAKLLYIVNIILQFVALNFIFPGFFTLGIDYFTKFTNNYYTTNTMFPRHTMCNFFARVLGNVQRHTVQCVLPINMVVEKEYLFLWYWMAGVGVVAVFSLCNWIIKIMYRPLAESFLLNHMWRGSFRIYTNKKEVTGSEGYTSELKMLQNGVRPFSKHLGADGYFLLQLIAHNTNAVTTTDIISELYTEWREDEAAHDLSSTEPTNGDRKQGALMSCVFE